MEKIAIIDLGSSKIDLILAEYTQGESFTVFEELSETVKIVDDFDGEGLLRVARSSEALAVLKMYRTICEVHKITRVLAFGSHSLKNLKNYRSFLDEIYNICGFKVKLLTEDEEFTALYTGIINSLDLPKAVVMNVSGGSVRLLQYSRRNILNQTTIPLGAYAIAKEFEENKDPETTCKNMVENFRKQIKDVEWLRHIDEEFAFVGVGNAFLNAGLLSRKLAKYPFDCAHNYVLTKSSLDDVYNLVKTLDIDKTKKIKGVSQDRADILASGICIIKALVDEFNIKETIVSQKGMKEGFIYMAVVPQTSDKPLQDLLGFSLDGIKKFYDKSTVNDHVSELALILFRQLRVLHKLPRGYVKVLRIAAALHDCGKRIKFYEHEKNSFHIVLNSEILGATHREIILSAFVCASQNLSEFSLADWVKYKDILQDEDLEAVRKLAFIVRMAEALDKTHRGVVQDVSCDILGDSVIMKTIVTIDASIEIREALKSANDFKRVYKKTLEVL